MDEDFFYPRLFCMPRNAVTLAHEYLSGHTTLAHIVALLSAHYLLIFLVLPTVPDPDGRFYRSPQSIADIFRS